MKKYVLIITLCVAAFVFGGGFLFGWWHPKSDDVRNNQVPSGGGEPYVHTPPQAPVPPKPVDDQMISFKIPPCATANLPETWGPAVKLAGKCTLSGKDYVGPPTDPTMYNYGGQPQKVEYHWTSDNPNIPLMIVYNDDFAHPVPMPDYIEAADPRTGQKVRTIHWGAPGKKGCTITVQWTPVSGSK